jgi:hypothetical protein
LINEVREAHPVIYDDLCILITPPRAQMEKVPRSRRPLLIMAMLALAFVLAMLGYRHALLGNFIYNIEAGADKFLPH